MCARCGRKPELRLDLDQLALIRKHLPELHPDTQLGVIKCHNCSHPVYLTARALYLAAPAGPVEDLRKTG